MLSSLKCEKIKSLYLEFEVEKYIWKDRYIMEPKRVANDVEIVERL